MGDGISKITDIRRVRNRGVLKGKAGEAVGIGSRIYDEIASSGLRAVVIPGLHRGVEALDSRFRALYSHCASAEKVSLGYHSYLKVKAENLIISDISSNTVTIGIKEGRFLGAMDACLGASGLVHGPLDLEALRRVDQGAITANEAFYSAGVSKIAKGKDLDGILDPKSEAQKLALRALIMSAQMEINGFLALIEPDAFVITGWAGVREGIFKVMKDAFEKFAPVYRVDSYAAAKGSAEIARDVLRGRRDFLGIKADF
jgi:putative methanogenesis marker protein 12